MSDLTQESSPVSCHFDYGALTRYGRPFQGRSSMTIESVQEVLQPPVQARGLGCSPFARHYSENLDLISFPLLLRCFSSQGDLPARKRAGSWNMTSMGFPHSEIPGYKRLPSGLPRLIAAGYVLLRSTESRHPCDAMSNVLHYCCSRVAGPQHLSMRGKERAGCARTLRT